MKRQQLFLLASLAAACTTVAWSVPASADDVVHSNLGPGNTYGGGAAYFVDRTASGSSSETAAAFTPSGDFTLTQIAVGILNLGGTNSVMLSLEGSNSHGLPNGTALASFPLTDLPPVGECTSLRGCVIQGSQIVKPTSLVELLKDTEYWLVASPPSTFSPNDWVTNDTDATGGTARNTGSGFFRLSPSSLAPAFEVLGTPAGVPEPATLGLMVLGLLGVGFAGRRRRN